MQSSQPKVEPVVYLLTGLVVFFTVALFGAERFFASDAVFFQAIAGILTTASGALFMKIKTDNTPQVPQVPQVPQLPQLPPEGAATVTTASPDPSLPIL